MFSNLEQGQKIQARLQWENKFCDATIESIHSSRHCIVVRYDKDGQTDKIYANEYTKRVGNCQLLNQLHEKLASLQRDNSSLNDNQIRNHREIRSLKRTISISPDKIKLQQENQALHTQVSELQKRLAQFECKENDIYIRNKVLSYKSKCKQNIKPRSDIDNKQKMFRDTFRQHDTKITNWMMFSQKMNKTYSECKAKTKDIGNENNTLWSSFNQCKLLWQQQQNQMESVAEILKKLGQQKRELKTYVSNHGKEAKQSNGIYQTQLKKYKQINETRIKLENELKVKLKQLNVYCDKENQLNETQCNLLDKFNTIDIELKKYESLLKYCGKLMKKYRDFDSVNEIAVNEMEKYFENKWIENMKRWYEWSAESIVFWLQYLRENGILMISGNVKLDKILQQMQNDDVDGNSLLDIDKNDLKSIGFEVLSDRQRVYNQIQQLISRYPRPTHHSDESKNDDKAITYSVKIPDEFKCPISKEIMKNPVITFDGNTYEKINIEEHVNKYRTSPITKEKCDKDDMWYTPNRKLKQKIELFLKVNPQYLHQQ